ncbi:MAG: glycosyltransferase family 2 protein [Clostridia bacterium]|nr:glycosyltransferase family 2 protein [Clostridia bacterium]MBQ8446298.1 glycosyltransferase family 2 protein [Clostridia bacterium]
MSKYSIVVPAYNEEKSLRLFYNAVVPLMDTLHEEYEMIFVNDGSKDKTLTILRELATEDKRVKVCSFSRNFGQQAALLCGLQAATGDAIIAMDADLQDPPEVALQMIEKWKEGYEVVHGKRRKRKGETIFKKATAFFYYRFMRKITGMEMPKDVGDFKLYDRKVVDAILSMGEHDRLLRAQVTWVGFKQTIIEFDRPERVAGETHYTLKKMIRLAESGIFPNTEYTLTLPIKLGLLFGFMSVACFITFIVLTCCNVAFGGLTAWLFPTVALIGSMLLVCQGLANIHTGMIYKEVQNRPKYIVSEKYNFED